jgi:putative DNA primase/helicase
MMNGPSPILDPDRDQIEKFVSAVFKHADREGRIALRGFSNQNNIPVILEDMRLGDHDFLDRVTALAADAANDPAGAVFSPPIAIFNESRSENGWLKANTENLKEGLTLSVECDKNPSEARQKLEALLGPATLVIASGGEWVDSETSAVEPKLHLHWVLKQPTRSEEEHNELYKARELAGRYVGADGSGKPIVHPYRWPGSWHTKRKPPRPVTIAASTNHEIELASTLSVLRDVVGDWDDLDEPTAGDPTAPLKDIEAAAEAMPNADEEYDQYISVGLAFYASSAGQWPEPFDKWSQKSKKHGLKITTAELWGRFRRSPPTRTGFGALVKRVRKTIPDWCQPSKRDERRGLTEEQWTEIRRLTNLSPVEYDRARKEAANRLEIRVTTLDDIVESLRPRTANDDNLQGTALVIPETELWPEAVDGAELVKNIEAAIKTHVIIDDDQALGIALWCIHTYARDAAEHYPRLHISSPAKRCGKTTLLRTIAPMVSRPLSTEHISNAALFRTIEMAKPTLIIDEVDTFLKDNDDMLRLLNAGHTHDGQVIRTVGEDFEPRSFSVAGPVVIAGIGRIPTTLEDRSITIPLRRKLKNERVTRLRSNRTAHLDKLGQQAARWVADHIIALKSTDPKVPEELNDRQQDNWRPLIAIADAMSADLGKRVSKAANAISSDETSEDDDAATMLLNDVAAIMERKNSDQTAQELVSELTSLEDRPWSEWRRGNPITKTGIARMLRPFGIRPKEMREGTATAKKYEKAKVLEAKTRYVDKAIPVAEEPF